MNKFFVLAILSILFQSCISTLRVPDKDVDDVTGSNVGASCKYVDVDSLENSINLEIAYFGSSNQTAAAALGMLLAYHDDNKIKTNLTNIIESAHKTFAPDDDKASIYDIMVEAENNGHSASMANCSISNLLEILTQKQPVILRMAQTNQIHAQYIVATGYNKELKVVYINDPLDELRDSISFDEIDKAWNINFLNSEDNTDSLMIIIR